MKILGKPSARRLRILHRKLVESLRSHFNKNMQFMIECLKVFCKSLKRDKQARETILFSKVRECWERHQKLQFFISKRFQDLKKAQANTGEYQISLREYVKREAESLKQFSEVGLYFPDFLKKWVTFQVDSELLISRDFVDHMHRAHLPDSTLVEDPMLERCLVAILQEKKEWSSKLREQELILRDLLETVHIEYTDHLNLQFHRSLKERFGHFIKEETVQVAHFGDTGKEKPMERHLKEADALRDSSYLKDILTGSLFNIENETLFQKIEWSPILFQEIYQKKQPKTNFVASSIRTKGHMRDMYNSKLITARKKHLVVLVHGYGGSHFDMSPYKNFLSMIIPHSVFLASKCNEEMEGKKIREMGKDLANEVRGAIKGHSNVTKVSFIGHSLGGVISRAALIFLEEFRTMMFSFVSLSSPHLGTVKNSSFLVNTGMFFLNKIKKDSVIIELQMNDSEKPRESFLYKLAQEDKLHWFNNLILVSSPQDSYVPYLSARIQPTKPNSNSKTNKVLQEMSGFIWQKVASDMIVRVDVDLRSPERCPS